MHRRTLLRAAAAGAPLLSAPRLLSGQEFEEMPPRQVQTIRRGLRWLAKNQFSSGAVGTTCQVAFTSIAGLAWMADGSTPYRGEYALPLRQALKFILRNCGRTSGFINEAAGRGVGGSGMHGHGYATWFLAELYGMCGDMIDLGDESVKERLQKAIAIIEQSQDPNGGWTYEPQPYGHEGSVTITQVQAMRSARNAGLSVKKETIRKGIDYIRRSTNEDGTIMYSLGGHRGGTYALTAAGMCVFSMYGVYDSPEVKRCLKALQEFLYDQRGTGGRRRRGSRHDFYAHLYAGQACFFLRNRVPELWTIGYRKIRDELIDGQVDEGDGTGYWPNDGYGGAFGTACACLVLQIPYRYLPIFQD